MKRNRLRPFRVPSLDRVIDVDRVADLWWQLTRAQRALGAMASAADAIGDHALALRAKKDRLRVNRRLRTIRHEQQKDQTS